MKHILQVTTPKNNTTVYLNADLIRGVCLSEDKKTTNILFDNTSDSYVPVVEDIDTVLKRIKELYAGEFDFMAYDDCAEEDCEEDEIDECEECQEGVAKGVNQAIRTMIFVLTDKVGLSLSKVYEIEREIRKQTGVEELD